MTYTLLDVVCMAHSGNTDADDLGAAAAEALANRPSNDDRAQWGAAAVRAGDPDHGKSDPATSLTDALANMMHAADAAGVDFAACLASAEDHHGSEAIQ